MMWQSFLIRATLPILIGWAVNGVAFADSPPQVDVRNGGVLTESYGYHHHATRPATYPPAGGWYGYGFPVTTYRWGWFGAERYYPRVVWHCDCDDACVRWAYRKGY
jgi:hypothetical protein